MKTECVLLLASISLSDLLNAITIPCYETYQAKNSHLCYPCSPGFYKFSDCVQDSEQARCFKCEADEYQPDCNNSTKCIKCRTHCPPGQEKVKNCSDIADIVCQCKNGRFWEPDVEKPDEGHCRKYSSCKPGEGLLEKGNPTQDTKCTKCQKGVTYSDRESFDSCTPCSKCNTTVVRNCTLNHDSVCGVETLQLNNYAKLESLGTGVVVVIVLSTVVLIVLAVFLLYCRRRNCRSPDTRDKSDVELNGKPVAEQTKGGENGNLSENGFVPDNLNGYLESKQVQKTVVQNGQEVSYHSIEKELANGVDESQKVSANGVAGPDRISQKVSANGTVANLLTSNHKVIEEGVRNKNGKYETSANNVSTVNSDDEYSENTDLSTDADAVPPRSILQSSRREGHTDNDEVSQNDKERQCEDEPDKEDVPYVADDSSVDMARPARSRSYPESIQTEPDFTENPPPRPVSDNIRTEQQAPVSEEKVWMETVSFVRCHLGWNDFKYFFRWLVVTTSEKLSETRDAEIDRVQCETGNNCQESIYQLMSNWRKATPKDTVQHVLDALKRAGQIKNYEKLKEIVKKMGVCVTDFKYNNVMATETAQNGEISVQESSPLEDMTREITHEDSQGENPQMLELKEYIQH